MKSFLETWKPVDGYEGLYQVSDFGEVRSLGMWANSKNGSKRFVKGRVLKPGKDRGGYLLVVLYKGGKAKTHKVHRLVAQAFIPNPNNLPEVNHIDEDKTSNVVTNLEWCDRMYNMTYGTRTERCSKKVLQLTLDSTLVKEWSSVNECGRNGFSIGSVAACCNNKYCSQGNVYKGFRWVYAEDYYKVA